MLSQLAARLSTRSLKYLLLGRSAEVKMSVKCLLMPDSNFRSNHTSTKFHPVTHVIFDMDGLLLDTETIYKKILSDIAESYGKKYTKEIQLKVLGTNEQSTAKIIVKECDLPITVEKFLETFRSMQTSYLENANLMTGAERLVNHLHKNNIPIAIATSSGEKSVEVKTRNHKTLFSLFHHIVMGSSDPEVKEGKPAPDIFMVCAKRFPDKPAYSKCLVFEDAPNGVRAATAAGMQTVMVPDTLLPPDSTKEATTVIKSLLEFKPEEFGLPPY